DVAVDGRLVDAEALGDLGDGVVAGGVGVEDLGAHLLEAFGVELAAGEAGLARPLVDAALAHAVLLGDLAHGELGRAVVGEHGVLGAGAGWGGGSLAGDAGLLGPVAHAGFAEVVLLGDLAHGEQALAVVAEHRLAARLLAGAGAAALQARFGRPVADGAGADAVLLGDRVEAVAGVLVVVEHQRLEVLVVALLVVLRLGGDAGLVGAGAQGAAADAVALGDLPQAAALAAQVLEGGGDDGVGQARAAAGAGEAGFLGPLDDAAGADLVLAGDLLHRQAALAVVVEHLLAEARFGVAGGGVLRLGFHASEGIGAKRFATPDYENEQESWGATVVAPQGWVRWGRCRRRTRCACRCRSGCSGAGRRRARLA